MDDRDTYEKENGSTNTQLLKCYLAIVGVVIGVLTMYQASVGVEAPFYLGAILAGGSSGYLYLFTQLRYESSRAK